MLIKRKVINHLADVRSALEHEAKLAARRAARREKKAKIQSEKELAYLQRVIEAKENGASEPVPDWDVQTAMLANDGRAVGAKWSTLKRYRPLDAPQMKGDWRHFERRDAWEYRVHRSQQVFEWVMGAKECREVMATIAPYSFAQLGRSDAPKVVERADGRFTVLGTDRKVQHVTRDASGEASVLRMSPLNRAARTSQDELLVKVASRNSWPIARYQEKPVTVERTYWHRQADGTLGTINLIHVVANPKLVGFKCGTEARTAERTVRGGETPVLVVREWARDKEVYQRASYTPKSHLKDVRWTGHTSLADSNVPRVAPLPSLVRVKASDPMPVAPAPKPATVPIGYQFVWDGCVLRHVVCKGRVPAPPAKAVSERLFPRWFDRVSIPLAK